MYSLLLFIVIIVSLAAIVLVLIRKLPQLTNLDLDSLPEEKISLKKKEIIGKRVEKRSNQIKEQFSKYSQPLDKAWSKVQGQFRIYVGRVQTLLHHEESAPKRKQKASSTPKEAAKQSDQQDKLEKIIAEGEQYLENNNFERAEEIFISALNVDSKSRSAYRGLGEVYLARNALEEARQTYQFLLRLEPDDDGVLVKLAEIAESQGDLEEAVEYYQKAVLVNDAFAPRFSHLAELLLQIEQPVVAKEAIVQAVELEPQNPKYLDLMAEIAIMAGDKKLAQTAYNDLRLANPNNEKLEKIKDKLDKLPKSS